RFVDAIGDRLRQADELAIAVENQIKRPIELATAAAPDARLPKPRPFVAVAEADHQGTFRLGDGMPLKVGIATLIIAVQMFFAVVIIQDALDELAAPQTGGLALARHGDFDIEQLT